MDILILNKVEGVDGSAKVSASGVLLKQVLNKGCLLYLEHYVDYNPGGSGITLLLVILTQNVYRYNMY